MKLHTIYRVSTSEGSPKVETVLLPGEILRWCSFNDETFYRNSFYATDRLLPLWIEVHWGMEGEQHQLRLWSCQQELIGC
jgi:hypothetical protein